MSTRNCQNCNTPHGPDDMFCENCGYDFITGSLPAEPVGVGAPPAAPSVLSPEGSGAEGGSGSGAGGQGADDPTGSMATAPADVPRLRVRVSVDRTYFDEVVNDGEIDFPDPAPAETELELAGNELHIGRTSESRAIHPDIDVADLTGDQAVSSRHAVLRVAADGGYTIVDVGSTNGTFLDAVDSEAITQGVPVDVQPGKPIFVGAWTRITIVD
jgi:hypothetical protein